MKTPSYIMPLLLLLALFGAINPVYLAGQQANFNHAFGTSFDNVFTKVVPSGTNYYVLGRDEPADGAVTRATVSRLNDQGQHQWTLSLNTGSQWNDAVLTPSGNLLLVGNSLPFDANTQGLMGLVTPSGAFSWLRSYSTTGRDWFNRVVLNPAPESANFPYYVLGGQWDPGGNTTWDDILLLTMSESGALGWKKIYTGPFNSTDDEFGRDLEALPNGDLLLAGNLGTTGVLFRAKNTGELYNGAGPEGLPFSFADVTQTGSGFYAVGNALSGFLAYLFKFDNDLLPVWQIAIPTLSAVSQVW
ncbi:MAG: hypothetical protein ACKVU2_16165, partial [Saprospiraceae bacterium]